MSRHPLALVLMGSAMFAAEPPASPPAAVVVTPPAPPRAISSAMADTLKAALPKSAFVKPPEKKSATTPLVLREPETLQGEIVNLPNYLVRESKPPEFSERELSANRVGLARLAVHRYFKEADRALNRFMLPLFATSHYIDLNPNESRAIELYYEDERLKNMSEVSDLTNMVTKSNAAAGAKVKDLSQAMFMHQTDFGWQGSGKK